MKRPTSFISDLKEVFRKAITYSAIILLCCFALGYVSQAHADGLSSQALQLPEDDLSRTGFFNFITCGSASNCSEWFASSTPLTAALGAFNTAILFLGGLLMAYTILGGILDTAHQGEVLGKKMADGYLPIRIGIGSALLMPVINGICGMQVIVLWVAMQGSALANIAWTASAAALVSTPVTTYSAQADEAEKLAVGLVRGFICQGAMNASGESTTATGSNPQAIITTGTSTPETFVAAFTPFNPGARTFGYSFGLNTNPTTIDRIFGFTPSAQCGRVEIKAAADIGSSSSSSAYEDAAANSSINSSVHSIQTAQSDAMQAMAPVAQVIAQRFQQSSNHLLQADLDSIRRMAEGYAQAVTRAEQAAMSASSNAATQAAVQTFTKGGWIKAGEFYSKASQVQTTLTSVSNSQSYSTPATSKDSGSSAVLVSAALDQFDTQIAAESSLSIAPLAAMNAASSSKTKDANQKGLLNQAGDFFSNPFKAVSSFINDRLKSITVSIITALSSDSDPLLQAQALGSYVIGAGDVLTLIAVTAGSLDFGIGMLSGSESLLLLGLGTMMQLILPMTPYFIWTGCVIGWMTLVVEALIGASLWAVAHIHPDADGIVGRAGQGYGLVIDLALRPVLMVLGLVFSLFLMKPIGLLVNRTFVPAFELALSNVDMGIVLFIGVIALYCSLMLTAVKKTFDLIWFVPDNVLRWFAGLNQIGLGRTGADIAQEALGGATAATRQATPAATNAAIGGSVGVARTSAKGIYTVAKRFKASDPDSTSDEKSDSAQSAKAEVEKRLVKSQTIRGRSQKESIEEKPEKSV